jgi:Cu/Ag efflux protein CusF
MASIRVLGVRLILAAFAASPLAAASQTDPAELTSGEVRKADNDAGKVTLKHGEIRNLDLPPMTIVFAVKDKAVLDGLREGDKVKCRVMNDNGKFTVTEIHPAR